MFKFRLLVFVYGFVAASTAAPTKIDQNLRKILIARNTANILVSFRDGTASTLNLITRAKFNGREERLQALTLALQANAAKSQKQLLEYLKFNYTSISFEVLWITNQIYVKSVDSVLIETISRFEEVFEIVEEEFIEIDDPIDFKVVSKISSGTEWGIRRIQSPEAWALDEGNMGEGVVVATIDTGVRPTHEALKHNFLGQYGWFDPYQGTSEPFDENGHGTHTTGIIAGHGGIGVAPGSKWMACKGCSGSWCTIPALISCGQFVICPTLPDGSHANCSKAPQVINNSWGGGRGITNYHAVIDAWNVAGIIPVFSNGNTGYPGASCNTANSPADHPNVIAVGSTTRSDELSPFSSVGPTYPDKLIKPDISAPGSEVVSSYNSADDAYVALSGTSMAGPHVAGVVALMKSHSPNLTFSDIQTYMYAGADRASLVQPGKNCGGIGDSVFPNHSFGYGRVNALEALKNLIQH